MYSGFKNNNESVLSNTNIKADNISNTNNHAYYIVTIATLILL